MALFGADPKNESAMTGALLVAEFFAEFRSIYKGLTKAK